MGAAMMAGAISSALSVSAMPERADSGGTSGSTVRPVTAIVSPSATGVTFLWTVLDASRPLTISSPTAATTGFVFSGTIPPGGFAEATVRCTVTLGALTASVDVPITFTNTLGSGGLQ